MKRQCEPFTQTENEHWNWVRECYPWLHWSEINHRIIWSDEIGVDE